MTQPVSSGSDLIQMMVLPAVDMRLQSDLALPVVGDTPAIVCRVIQPGTFTPLDPDGFTLIAVARSPAGIIESLGVTRVSPGVYWAPVTLTAPGDWFVRFTATMSTIPVFAEMQVYCQPAAF